jgi:hypothetical protein
VNFSFIGPLILDCATDCRRQRVIAGFLFAYCLDLAGKYLVAEVAKDVPIQRYHSLKQRAVNSDNHSAVANNASVFLLFAHRCRYFFKQRIFLFRVRIRLRLGLQKLTMARLVAAETTCGLVIALSLDSGCLVSVKCGFGLPIAVDNRSEQILCLYFV